MQEIKNKTKQRNMYVSAFTVYPGNTALLLFCLSGWGYKQNCYFDSIEQQTTKCLPPILVKCLFGQNFNKFRCALFKLAYLNIHFSQTIIAKIKFRN